MKILEIYKDFAENYLAIPVIAGQKTPSEKFAGAVDTYSIEAMMKDGRAVQAGTSHYMGTNFAEAFEIQYLDRDNKQQYAYTTSWGVTTRLIGSIIMVHGDDRGLVMPPKVAPTQVVIIPIGPPSKRDAVIAKANEIYEQLKQQDVRVKLDDDPDQRPGWKFSEYEMRGVPLRIEIGPRDLEQNQAVFATRTSGDKQFVPLDQIGEKVISQLEFIQKEMLEKAQAFMQQHSHSVETIDELKEIFEKQRGFVQAGWCGSEACEHQVQEETGATSRNIPTEVSEHKSKCLVCEEAAKHTVVFARAY